MVENTRVHIFGRKIFIYSFLLILLQLGHHGQKLLIFLISGFAHLFQQSFLTFDLGQLLLQKFIKSLDSFLVVLISGAVVVFFELKIWPIFFQNFLRTLFWQRIQAFFKILLVISKQPELGWVHHIWQSRTLPQENLQVAPALFYKIIMSFCTLISLFLWNWWNIYARPSFSQNSR